MLRCRLRVWMQPADSDVVRRISGRMSADFVRSGIVHCGPTSPPPTSCCDEPEQDRTLTLDRIRLDDLVSTLTAWPWAFRSEAPDVPECPMCPNGW